VVTVAVIVLVIADKVPMDSNVLVIPNQSRLVEKLVKSEVVNVTLKHNFSSSYRNCFDEMIDG
jgi:hypothetical protein